jgi:hypothetical protein
MLRHACGFNEPPLEHRQPPQRRLSRHPDYHGCAVSGSPGLGSRRRAPIESGCTWPRIVSRAPRM